MPSASRWIIGGLVLTTLFAVFGLVLHEAGHYIACQQLIGDAQMRLPALTGRHGLGGAAGYVRIPNVNCAPWKVTVVLLAGGWTAAAFFGLILFTTDSDLVGVVSSAFFVYSFVYGITETLHASHMISSSYMLAIPAILAGVVSITYAAEAG